MKEILETKTELYDKIKSIVDLGLLGKLIL